MVDTLFHFKSRIQAVHCLIPFSVSLSFEFTQETFNTQSWVRDILWCTAKSDPKKRCTLILLLPRVCRRATKAIEYGEACAMWCGVSHVFSTYQHGHASAASAQLLFFRFRMKDVLRKKWRLRRPHTCLPLCVTQLPFLGRETHQSTMGAFALGIYIYIHKCHRIFPYFHVYILCTLYMNSMYYY